MATGNRAADRMEASAKTGPLRDLRERRIMYCVTHLRASRQWRLQLLLILTGCRRMEPSASGKSCESNRPIYGPRTVQLHIGLNRSSAYDLS